jgi:hypothetical protein
MSSLSCHIAVDFTFALGSSDWVQGSDRQWMNQVLRRRRRRTVILCPEHCSAARVTVSLWFQFNFEPQAWMHLSLRYPSPSPRISPA